MTGDTTLITDSIQSPRIPKTTIPSFTDIIRKICDTPSLDASLIYVVCDEAALPVNKSEIRDTARSEFGAELYWKSDFLPSDELDQLSLLSLSCLDFEMAVGAESFVGLSRSTFSNMVSLEKYARTGAPAEHQYIYNLAGPGVALRTDNGAFSVPKLAVASEEARAVQHFERGEILRAGGMPRKALAAYSLCAASDQSDREEMFLSLYHSAQLKAQLGFSAAEVIDTYSQATRVLPSRAEAAHGASRYCRLHQMFREGYEIAAGAIDLPAPAEGRQVEHWIYERGLLDEYAVNAHWAGRHVECVRACLEILRRNKELPDADHSRIVSNARASLENLAAQLARRVEHRSRFGHGHSPPQSRQDQR